MAQSLMAIGLILMSMAFGLMGLEYNHAFRWALRSASIVLLAWSLTDSLKVKASR